MRHARPDYNRIQDPAGLIPQDEPVFLLRAQDRFAPDTVLYWSSEAEQAGADALIVEMARGQAAEMARWQNEHPILTYDVTMREEGDNAVETSHTGKVPDLPEDLEAYRDLLPEDAMSDNTRAMFRKQSSPELSSRAAVLMSLDDDEMRKAFLDEGSFDKDACEPRLRPDVCKLIRSLAASVVSQDETKGQPS